MQQRGVPESVLPAGRYPHPRRAHRRADPAEADQFFRILVRLRSEGKTIILITHKLREIMEITDTVSVCAAAR